MAEIARRMLSLVRYLIEIFPANRPVVLHSLVTLLPCPLSWLLSFLSSKGRYDRMEYKDVNYHPAFGSQKRSPEGKRQQALPLPLDETAHQRDSNCSLL